MYPAAGVLVYVVIKAIYSAVTESAGNGAAPKATPPPVTKGFAVPCSLCGAAQMETAHRLYVVRGRGLFTSLERRTLAGCRKCVRREGVRTIGRVLLHGPWSLGGIIAAPGAAAYDLILLFGSEDLPLAEQLIREAGLDPDTVRLDEDGLTRHERLEVHATACAAARIIWADRRSATRIYLVAQEHLQRLTSGRVSLDKIEMLLSDPRYERMPRYHLDPLAKAALYRLLKQLALAEGPASPRIYEQLRDVTGGLGFTARESADLLQEIASLSRQEQVRRDEQARASARARAAEDARQGANAGEGRGARGARNGRDELARARAVLGVPAGASWPAIIAAYRASIAIWHPDRAGLDVRKQEEFTRRSQEITWAKDALRRAAGVSWT